MVQTAENGDQDRRVLSRAVSVTVSYSFISRTVSPVCDLILEKCVVVFQREMRHFQKVHPTSLCTDAEQVT